MFTFGDPIIRDLHAVGAVVYDPKDEPPRRPFHIDEISREHFLARSHVHVLPRLHTYGLLRMKSKCPQLDETIASTKILASFTKFHPEAL